MCGACALKITNESDRVYCFGGCDQILHVKCSDLKATAISALNENVALKYICFGCRKKHLSLCDMQKKCNELLDGLKNSRQIYENVSQQLSDDIMLKTTNLLENQLKAFETKIIDQLMNRLNDLPLNVASDTVRDQPPQRSYAAVTRSTAPKRKADSAPTIDQPNKKKSNLTPTTLTDGGVLRSGKRRFVYPADQEKQIEPSDGLAPHTCPDVPVQKSKSAVQQSVRIKPKNSQQANLTKSDVCDKLDPVSLSIKKAYFKPNGEAVLRCDSPAMSAKLLETANSVLGESYDVELQKPLKPRLKIFGLSEAIAESDLLLKLRKQNDLPDDIELKLIRTYSNSAIIECDAKTFEKLKNLQRVNIGWERCRVWEYIDVFRCYRCSEYGHIASSCSKPLCCPKCTGQHERKDCCSDFVKCVNCSVANSANTESNAVLLDTNHPAWSSLCPFHQQRIKKKRHQIDYST